MTGTEELKEICSKYHNKSKTNELTVEEKVEWAEADYELYQLVEEQEGGDQ